jgi:hypothetical protein
MPPVPGGPGKPGVVAKAGAVPPQVKPGAAGQKPVDPNNPEEDEPLGPKLTFWQQPWVQNILPFVTSLTAHAAVLIFGLLIFGAVKLIEKPPLREETIIPDSNMVENGPPGGIPNVGLGADPLRQTAQDKDPSSKTQEWAEKKGPTVDISNVGGGAGDDSAGPIQAGPGAAFGSGSGAGAGSGSGHGGGGGDATGPMAMYGAPGGGGIGPKGPVFGAGGNARMIVFLCDATGSMINKMATLKDELNKAVVGLKPIQSFDIIFYQDVKVEPFQPTLVPATPESKRRAGTYLEGVTATGTTDPIPALTKALQLKPQLLYFLTDAADFPDPQALLDTIKKYNPDRKIKINTILFVENKAEHEKNADSEGLMKGIAKDNGGNFRWVEMDNIP